MVREDFVDVRLTKRGEELGGVTVAGGNFEYEFRPGETTRVTRAEFEERLRRAYHDHDGEALLEVVAKEGEGK